MLTDGQLEDYNRDGFVHVPGLWDAEEVERLQAWSRASAAIRENTLARDDSEGGTTRLSLWRDAGNDPLGVVARSRRMVEAAAQCVGGEVYHWHSKLIQKDAGTGGAWIWHQDYGYWYNDGCLFPRLVSCFVAIDRATRENGCLQVLNGSHHLGRIDHVPVGGQTGADPERVAAAEGQLERVYCEMEPGDALFFHCNALHRSDQNRSDKPRWALICCYNAASNSPVGETWQPSYSKMEVLPDSALKEMDFTAVSESGKEFLTR